MQSLPAFKPRYKVIRSEIQGEEVVPWLRSLCLMHNSTAFDYHCWQRTLHAGEQINLVRCTCMYSRLFALICWNIKQEVVFFPAYFLCRITTVQAVCFSAWHIVLFFSGHRIWHRFVLWKSSLYSIPIKPYNIHTYVQSSGCPWNLY